MRIRGPWDDLRYTPDDSLDVEMQADQGQIHQVLMNLYANAADAMDAGVSWEADIWGRLANRTRAAVRGYQKPKGLDSGILSMDAARALGLVAQVRPVSEG